MPESTGGATGVVRNLWRVERSSKWDSSISRASLVPCYRLGLGSLDEQGVLRVSLVGGRVGSEVGEAQRPFGVGR